MKCSPVRRIILRARGEIGLRFQGSSWRPLWRPLKSEAMTEPKDEFMELVEQGFGWINRSGRCIACGMYDHLDKAMVNIDDPAARREFEEGMEVVRETREMCEEADEREGSTNAEWHLYDMASDKFKDALVRFLYGDGWVRVGSRHGISGYGRKRVRL